LSSSRFSPSNSGLRIRNDEVVGSIPTSSTKIPFLQAFLEVTHRSREVAEGNCALMPTIVMPKIIMPTIIVLKIIAPCL
jgi:uncharacterized transporter YbjL